MKITITHKVSKIKNRSQQLVVFTMRDESTLLHLIDAICNVSVASENALDSYAHVCVSFINSP